jgi:di/tricarboxylate transporter
VQVLGRSGLLDGIAALLGGLCSVIGTPANLIVSQQLAERTGRSFAFFDFVWAGVPVAIAGLAAILLWVRLPLGTTPAASPRLPGQAARSW